MDKKILKDFLTTTATGTEFGISFAGELASLSGDYKLMEVARGRGKCGSQIAKIMSLTTGDVLSEVTVDRRLKSFGTPVSDMILNISCEGKTYGNGSTELEKNFPIPRDERKAMALKSTFEEYVGKEFKPFSVKITSDEKWLDGEWSCAKVVRNPGRQGQLTVTLTSGTQTIEFWTYRHSGAVTNLELLTESQETDSM